ncbi:MAG TPA: ATP-binding protein [Kofleriaceae bacterium]|nr:ATP-binding protein [Kofleriaceae bacterium]
MPRQLNLTIWPDLNLVSVVRRFAEEALEKALDDLDAVSRAAMAVHELVENAAKYGSGGAIDLHVELEGAEITIEVTNRATPEAQNALRAAFAEMEMADSPLDHYQALLRRAARRTTGSGLGLARVAFEGEMSVAARFDGDAVRVRAVTRAS